MTYRIKITAAAKRDAKHHARFLREVRNSPEAARKWLADLQAAMLTLDEMPERFAVIPESGLLGSQYRDFLFHSHRVVYSVDEKKGLVKIHRVYHGARRPLSPEDLL